MKKIKCSKGDVVVLSFPFSDLSSSKKRPALVIADLKGDDLILAQITSQTKKDSYSIELNENDFKIGTLKVQSNLRPNRLFTADKSIILYKIATLKKEKIKEVEDELVKIIKM